MAMNFGKLNFAVGFNRTSAFPLDANSYFEDLASAQAAAAGAAEVGSSDSAYYIGQLIIVTTGGVSDLYQITGTVGNSSLKKFGQASSAEELKTDLDKLKARFDLLVTALPVKETKNASGDVTGYTLNAATAEKDGFMSKEQASKLAGIEEGANKTVVDAELTDDGVNPVQGKAIKAAIAQLDGDITNLEGTVENKVDKVEGKGLSTNDYDNAAKAIVDGVTAKLDKKVDKVDGMGLSHNDYDDAAKAIVDGIEAKVTAEEERAEGVEQGLDTRLTAAEGTITTHGTDIADLKTKISGITGAMHFKGVVTEVPTDLTSYEVGDVVVVHNAESKNDKKEFVCAEIDGKKEFVELGDEGSHLTKEEAAKTYETKEDAKRIEDTIQSVEEEVTTLKTDTIPNAKQEAITAAGEAADTKIATALKDYTTTEDLNAELAKKANASTLENYVEKITTAGPNDRAYGVSGSGVQTVFNVDTGATAGSLARRGTNGELAVGTPTATSSATTKKYVDDSLAKKVDVAEGKSLISDELITKINDLKVPTAGNGIVIDDTGKISIEIGDDELTIRQVEGLQDALDAKQTVDQVNALIQAATIQGSKVSGQVALATKAGTADTVGHVLTAGGKTFNGSEDVEITAADLGALTSVPVASDSVLGGVKIGTGIDVTKDGTISVSIPSALVKSINEEQLAVDEQGKLSVKAVSTDLLVQGNDTLILDCGAAADFNA